MTSIRAACLAAVAVAGSVRAGEVHVWFGTYTSPRSGAEGIYASRFDTDTGALSPPVLAAAAGSPSFLALHPRLPVLYAVSEIAAAGGRAVGSVEAFAIDRASGALESLGGQATGGGGPCHLAVHPDGSVVLAANYGGGSVACLALEADGRVRPLVADGNARGLVQHVFDRPGAAGIDPGRQAGPHAHSVDVAPDGGHVLSCDLGLDRVLVHRLDRTRATLEPLAVSARVRPGAGPRHLAFHPDGRRAWCVNELDLTVTALDYVGGRLTVGPTLSTLPPDATDRTGFSCAEIAVHPGGRFVYASNRGHDSIAMFRIVGAGGELEFLGTEPTRTRTPRHFAIVGGRFLLAGGQASNDVAVFMIDGATGRLSFTGTSIDVPSPVCIVAAP